MILSHGFRKVSPCDLAPLVFDCDTENHGRRVWKSRDGQLTVVRKAKTGDWDREKDREDARGHLPYPFCPFWDQTQDLMHARQVFHCWATSPALPSFSVHLSLQSTGWCCLQSGLISPGCLQKYPCQHGSLLGDSVFSMWFNWWSRLAVVCMEQVAPLSKVRRQVAEALWTRVPELNWNPFWV